MPLPEWVQRDKLVSSPFPVLLKAAAAAAVQVDLWKLSPWVASPPYPRSCRCRHWGPTAPGTRVLLAQATPTAQNNNNNYKKPSCCYGSWLYLPALEGKQCKLTSLLTLLANVNFRPHNQTYWWTNCNASIWVQSLPPFAEIGSVRGSTLYHRVAQWLGSLFTYSDSALAGCTI